MTLKNIVSKPHDGFFQAVLGNRDAAGNFFENYLSADILKLLDMKTLQIKKDNIP